MERPPTRVGIMTYRYVQLCETLAAYSQTGISLIAFDGSSYFQPGPSDDSGMFYYLPHLARPLGISLDRAIDLFYGGIATISFTSGLVGLLFLLRSFLARLLGTIGFLVIFALCFYKGDIYLIQSSIVITVVPWFLYLVQRKANPATLLFFAIGVGLCSGVANNIRAHAGTVVTIFVALITLLHTGWARWQKLVLVGSMLLALLLPILHFRHLLASRDAYLAAIQPNGTYPPRGRAYWHTIYIGFGFLTNPYVPAYLDQVANKKA